MCAKYSNNYKHFAYKPLSKVETEYHEHGKTKCSLSQEEYQELYYTAVACYLLPKNNNDKGFSLKYLCFLFFNPFCPNCFTPPLLLSINTFSTPTSPHPHPHPPDPLFVYSLLCPFSRYLCSHYLQAYGLFL